MTVQTFVCEWDTDRLETMLVAYNTLRAKANKVGQMMLDLANALIDEEVIEVE